MVNGLATPKAGETPDYTATTAYPEWYQLDPIYAGTNGIVWFDEEGHQMDPSDKFQAGKTYRVEIKVISAKQNGANASRFVFPVTAYVNGKQVEPNDDWDMVYGNSTAVYIYYSFTVPAPEISSGNVSGVVTTGGREEDDVTIQLIPRGANEAEYAIVQSGNSVEYFFFAVKAGTYTIRVMKNGHETYETELVVGSAGVILDITLVELAPAYTPGDLNGDGAVNNRDLALMQQYINKWEVTINTDAADVNKDGAVNNRDLALLQQYINKWDVELL